MERSKTLNLVLCGFFAALSAVLSQISIPIQPVPIVLTHISIFMSAGLLGAKYGAISQGIFVLLGAVGLPVFSGFAGGLGIIAGPKGGYIIGYIICALVTGFIIEKLGKSMPILIFSMTIGALLLYVFGTAWFMIVTHTGFWESLTLCVFPFLIGDAVKIIISSLLVLKISKAL